ncbi:MAG: threonine/serine dehydratase [Bacteroidota bacterium]
MTKEELLACHERIKPYIHRTPVLQSSLLNKMAGAEVFFKCENFQRMGAFKFRGAVNSIMQLTDEQRAKGVVTHSSGNFAQGLALSARSLGVKAHIVMPESAPSVKIQAVRDYGGHITLCPSTLQDREAATQRIVDEIGAVLLHPSNAVDVILGQGTACMELLEDHPDLDCVLAPIGGGGLMAGTALAAHFFGNNCKAVGGEPFAVDDAYRSLQSGRIETNETTDTIADGLKTVLGDKTFPVLQQYLDRIIRVEEEEIVAAMRVIWERMKVIIETSCAVPFAAVLREQEAFEGKKIGIILSGGNVDLSRLPF